MKTLKNSLFAVAGVIALCTTACKKDASLPASKSSHVSFQLKADNDASSLTTNSTFSFIQGLAFTSGTANISQFKLEATRNGSETELSSRNLMNVDLFAATPSIANVSIDTGFYRKIEIRVVFRHTIIGDIPLKLAGSFTTGKGTVIPIEFDLNDDATVSAEGHDVHVTSTSDLFALVHLHLRQLERGISAAELASATLTNGTIVISRDSNTAIYNKVLANLSNAGETEFDDHGHHGGDDNGDDHGGGDNSGPGNGNGNNGGDDGSGHH